MMNISERLKKVRDLERMYLAHKYIGTNENSLESIRTFGEWHSAASVIFCEFLPKDDQFFKKFVEADTSGNAYVLADVYDSIHTSYEILMSKMEKEQTFRGNGDSVETMDDTPLIFISHSSKDKEIIKLFIDYILEKGLGLKDEDIACTSFESTGVNPGDSIPLYIKKNIKGAKICLAMVSKNYKSSEVCMNEVGAAWALNNSPIQIVLPGTEFNELGWLLNTDKAIKIDDNDCLDSLEEKLCQSLGIQIPTARHWNPCTKDFLKSLRIIIKTCNDEDPNVIVTLANGSQTQICHPQYYKITYIEKSIQEQSCDKIDAVKKTVIGGLSPDLLNAIQQSMIKIPSVQFSGAKKVSGTVNYSYCRIQLFLKNNSKKAVENGTIHICSDNEKVLFVESNKKESHSFANFAPRINQSINKHIVTEFFQKPINPTATERLYDFYISAPVEITEFNLNWKLESLLEPQFGKIKIQWQPIFESKDVEVEPNDKRIGKTEIQEYIIEK